MTQEFDIDAVITWVDGNDPEHKSKLSSYKNQASHVESIKPTRFCDDGELGFCVTSILRFAPFVRYIFIVTDNQKPHWLNSLFKTRPDLKNKIRIIDHREIFFGFEEFLPTFNSRSIELLLHRIPELSEHFLSFNDDFFICQNSSPTDFFENNTPVIKTTQKKFYNQRVSHKWKTLRNFFAPQKKARPGFFISQQISAKQLGFHDFYYQIDHHPHPLRKSTLKNFFENKKIFLKENISYRFRNASQLSMVSLSNHLEIKLGTLPIEENKNFGYIEPKGKTQTDIHYFFEQAFQNKKYMSICIQSLDESEPAIRKMILSKLREHYHPEDYGIDI